jgi:hypothetical protein
MRISADDKKLVLDLLIPADDATDEALTDYLRVEQYLRKVVFMPYYYRTLFLNFRCVGPKACNRSRVVAK